MRRAQGGATTLLLTGTLGLASTVQAATVGLTVFEGQLQRFNLETAALEPVGPLDRQLADLAFMPDGRLLGIDPDTDTLVSIDPDTAATSVIGDLGLDVPPALANVGLSSNLDSSLWLLANEGLYRIDIGSGAADLVCDLSGQPFASSCTGLAWHHGELYSLDDGLVAIDPVACTTSMVIWNTGTDSLDSDGRYLYGFHRRQVGPFLDGGVFVLWFDPETQEQGQLGGVALDPWFDLTGLAIFPTGNQVRAVPTLSPTALGLLMLAMGAAGVLVLRRVA